jgi:hypothetical protein
VLHYEKCHNLYYSPNVAIFIKLSIILAEHVKRVREMRNTLKIYVRNPQWKRSFWRSLCRVDDVTMDRKIKGHKMVDWIELAQCRVQWQDSMNGDKLSVL